MAAAINEKTPPENAYRKSNSTATTIPATTDELAALGQQAYMPRIIICNNC